MRRAPLSSIIKLWAWDRVPPGCVSLNTAGGLVFAGTVRWGRAGR